MTTFTETATATYFVQTCCNCGLKFGIEDGLDDRLRRSGNTFYCTNGHPQSYTCTDRKKISKLERQLKSSELALATATRRADNNANARDKARRSASAQRGVTTRIKNRIANGTCPCCGRTFDDLRQHMANKHPNFEEELR